MPGLDARLSEVLQHHPAVLVAYLYGSAARGSQTPLSDVDVAVLLGDGVDPHRTRLELLDSLASIVAPARADLVVLNETPVALAYRVLRDGRVVFCRDEAARVRHWATTVDRYIDMAPMRRILDEGTKHRITEGRFGRS